MPKSTVVLMDAFVDCEVCECDYDARGTWPLYRCAFRDSDETFIVCTPCLHTSDTSAIDIVSHGLIRQGIDMWEATKELLESGRGEV